MLRFEQMASALSCLALCVAILPADQVEAATRSFTLELRRLDAQGNELPADAVGDLSLRYGGVTTAEAQASVGAIFGRAAAAALGHAACPDGDQ